MLSKISHHNLFKTNCPNTRSEAAQIVAVSELMGYSFDADYTFAAAGGGGGAEGGDGRSSGTPAALPEVFLVAVAAGAAEDDEAAGATTNVVDKEPLDSSGGFEAGAASGGGAAEHGAQESASPPHTGLLSAARASVGGERAAGCVWLADDTLLGPVSCCTNCAQN